jgi:hypothetical protein
MSQLKQKKTWGQLKTLVEFSRKLLVNINGDIPSNISFREVLNEQTGQLENRIYFLAGGPKREVTIKYINIGPNDNQERITSIPLFQNNIVNMVKEKQQLTKEEQLLRERKRCSFNGISSYFLDNNSNRLVFSERSELFFYDDEQIQPNVNLKTDYVFELKPFEYNILRKINFRPK